MNHNLDALVTLGIQAVGTAMHERLVAQGKGGSGMRTQANYDGWWNGGMRNHRHVSQLHRAPHRDYRQPDAHGDSADPGRSNLYISDLPLPIAPQPWHFRQTIDYLMETNRGMLDFASRNRENLLFNIWRMGMNSIERGSKDYWTITPKRVEALRAAAGPIGCAERTRGPTGAGPGRRRRYAWWWRRRWTRRLRGAL
ncbi:MAG: hypothetical protein WDO73_00965 [Ignavibacteriota bacterium]